MCAAQSWRVIDAAFCRRHCSRRALARTLAGRCSAAFAKRSVCFAQATLPRTAAALICSTLVIVPPHAAAAAVTTTVTSTPGCFVWAVAAILCLVLPPCCFIPFCGERPPMRCFSGGRGAAAVPAACPRRPPVPPVPPPARSAQLHGLCALVQQLPRDAGRGPGLVLSGRCAAAPAGGAPAPAMRRRGARACVCAKPAPSSHLRTRGGGRFVPPRPCARARVLVAVACRQS